jgi:hypothetical protein
MPPRSRRIASSTAAVVMLAIPVAMSVRPSGGNTATIALLW